METALDKLNGLLGGLVSSGKDSAEELSDKLGELFSKLTGSEDGENVTEAPAFVAAENIEQFYGSWQFSKATLGGKTFSMDQLGDVKSSISSKLIISSDGITNDSDSSKVDVSVLQKHTLELVDGELHVTDGNKSFVMHLTEAGELYFEFGSFMGLYFTRVEE